MISVRSLVASSGPFRLRPTDLEVERGELLVLLGPSGAGKTVLLESLLGLREIHEGGIVIDGRDVTKTPPEARHVAYMPQDVALFPHLSIRENIEFGRKVRGHRAALAEDVARIGEALGITHLLERRSIRSLSGGEAQRVALARALITQPRVLFLDESFSALDAHIRRRLLAQFRVLQQEMRLTAIYVTHSLTEAALVADRIAVLIDGSIVQAATPQRLFREPHDLRVARFLQLENLYAMTSIENTCCRLGDLELQLAAASTIRGPAWIAFAASDVMIVHDGDDVGTSNCLVGSIATFEQRHDHSRVRVAVDGSEVVIECDVTVRDRLRLGPTLVPGATVHVYIPPTAIAVLPEAT